VFAAVCCSMLIEQLPVADVKTPKYVATEMFATFWLLTPPAESSTQKGRKPCAHGDRTRLRADQPPFELPEGRERLGSGASGQVCP
jgi:hypothetical protein